MNTEPKKTLLKRRLKYGGLAVALAAAVVVVAIIANILVTNLAQRNVLYTDMTSSSLYTLSDEAKSYLSQIKSPITVKFAVPLDTIKSNQMLDLVYNTAMQFSRASTDEDKDGSIPDITVEYFDSYKYPAQFEKYKQLTTSWSSSNVIIESTREAEDGEEAALPIVYTLDAFYVTSSASGSAKTVGYNGERRFLLAFLQLAGVERPVVSFTVGHGEPIGKNPTDADNQYYDFISMFEEYGFRIQYVDLTKEDLDKDCRLVVILDPQRDFIGKSTGSFSEISELDKIEAFTSAHGSVMVFLGPTGGEYKNLGQYLEEWNVTVYTGYTVEDPENTLSSDNRSFSVKYTTEGFGASVQQHYRNMRTKFDHAAPVKITAVSDSTTSFDVTSSFRTSSSALAYASDEDVLTPADLGNPDGFDLFVVSSRLKYENNEQYYSYVLTCGCPEMLKYCTSQAYANRGVLNVLITRIPLLKLPVDIDYKNLEDFGMSSVTSSAARVWMIVLAIAIPLATLAAGTVVVTVRKRR